MRSAIVLFFAMLLAAPACWGADAYPSKPVRLIVALGPGGASDFNARLIARQLSTQTGQQFFVENRGGAGGIIGNQLAANAPADGYTILLIDVTFVMVPGLHKTMPYDVIKDFTPITQFSLMPNVLVVNPSLNVGTLADFIALARANPKKINYGTSGIGTVGHLAGELFKIAAHVDINHIPYKGGGELVPALLGGQVQALLPPISTVLSFVKSGHLRALAVMTDGKRSTSLPDVPTTAEAGLSSVAVSTWFGLVGPRGLPPEIVNKLHDEVAKALAEPSVKQQFEAQGAEAVGSTPAEFGDLIRTELRRWSDLIDAAGIPKTE